MWADLVGAMRIGFDHFRANSGSQARAFQITVDVTKKIDKRFGTTIMTDLLKNLEDLKYTPY